MNEPIFNSAHHLNRSYTIVIRQQWLPPGVSNCMVFNFNIHLFTKSVCKMLSCRISVHGYRYCSLLQSFYLWLSKLLTLVEFLFMVISYCPLLQSFYYGYLYCSLLYSFYLWLSSTAHSCRVSIMAISYCSLLQNFYLWLSPTAHSYRFFIYGHLYCSLLQSFCLWLFPTAHSCRVFVYGYLILLTLVEFIL